MTTDNKENLDQDKDLKNQDPNLKDNNNGQDIEAKFTQEDLNKYATKIRAEEKAKYEKLKADADREAELAKMEENERLKEEKNDMQKQYEELQAKVEYNEKRTEAIAKLSEAKLDARLIDVLMSDKSNEDKIQLMADIQKDVVDKAIKDAMPSHQPGGSGTNLKTGFDSEEKFKYNFQKFK